MKVFFFFSFEVSYVVFKVSGRMNENFLYHSAIRLLFRDLRELDGVKFYTGSCCKVVRAILRQLVDFNCRNFNF